MSYLPQELAYDRIRTYMYEAENHREAKRVLDVERARRQVERATARLHRALVRSL